MTFLKIFKKSFFYYWPIIFSSLVSILIMNFGKVYSYYQLPIEDMTRLSFTLRFLLIIQLFHATFSSFFLKKNFESSRKFIDLSLLKKYFIGVVLSIFVVNFFYNYSYLIFNIEYSIDKIYLFLLLYIIVWVISSYFEQFLGKFNKNLLIMFLQIISMLIYFLPFLIFNTVTLYQISILMFSSVTFYFFGIMIFLYKVKIKIE